MHLPYDPESPPAEPPPGSDRLLWQLSFGLHSDHQPDGSGRCATCRPRVIWPCEPSRLSALGFTIAIRRGPSAQPAQSAASGLLVQAGPVDRPDRSGSVGRPVPPGPVDHLAEADPSGQGGWSARPGHPAPSWPYGPAGYR